MLCRARWPRLFAAARRYHRPHRGRGGQSRDHDQRHRAADPRRRFPERHEARPLSPRPAQDRRGDGRSEADPRASWKPAAIPSRPALISTPRTPIQEEILSRPTTNTAARWPNTASPKPTRRNNSTGSGLGPASSSLRFRAAVQVNDQDMQDYFDKTVAPGGARRRIPARRSRSMISATRSAPSSRAIARTSR